MGSRSARHRYCRCGTHLAADNNELQCARCQQASRDKLIAPPIVPAGFWQHEQLREAFTAQHLGRVSGAYRTHPHHHAVYGPSGISQPLLGHWLGLRQPQISRIETGLPIRDLDTLVYWARVLRIPAELLWFDLPGQTRKATLDAEPLPTPPTSAQRVLLPAVVDGQSVLLRLDAETLALGELSITSLAGGSVLSDELLSAFDFDVDELRHVTVALADSRRYLDGSVVEHFQRQLDTCETDDGALGPAKVLPGVLGILGTIEEHAREVKPGVRRELLWYWHDRATEWAQEAGDTAMQGYVLLKKAQGAYDNRDALRMLMLAQATLNGPWQLPARVRAEATQQEARGLAMLGEPMSLIEQKLDDARRFLGDATPDDEQTGQLGIHYTSSLLTMQTAICYNEAGQPSRAAELYGKWLSGNAFSRRDYGYFLSLRAHSLALAGEPDAAAEVGLEAFSLARDTDSQRTVANSPNCLPRSGLGLAVW